MNSLQFKNRKDCLLSAVSCLVPRSTSHAAVIEELVFFVSWITQVDIDGSARSARNCQWTRRCGHRWLTLDTRRGWPDKGHRRIGENVVEGVSGRGNVGASERAIGQRHFIALERGGGILLIP